MEKRKEISDQFSSIDAAEIAIQACKIDKETPWEKLAKIYPIISWKQQFKQQYDKSNS
jgi:hypothetical protein